ncbi:unnamed protein product, partial [Larinioides sclopetarius]
MNDCGEITPEPEIHWSEVRGTRWPRICKGTCDDSLTKVLLQHSSNTSGNVWRSTILHPCNVIDDISLLQFWNYVILQHCFIPSTCDG